MAKHVAPAIALSVLVAVYKLLWPGIQKVLIFSVIIWVWMIHNTGKNVCFRKRFPYYKTGNSNTAANIHNALLPLFTHYKGMLVHCKQGLEWLACCFKQI